MVFNVYARVQKAREDLARKALELESLVHAGDERADIWCVCMCM